eukprot:gene14801-20017_t
MNAPPVSALQDMGAELNETKPVLLVEHLTVSFDGFKAVDDLSMRINERELRVVIGPNGAGKSSLMNCLSGFYRPKKGEISLAGRNVRDMAVHDAAAQRQIGRAQGSLGVTRAPFRSDTARPRREPPG